MERGWHHWLLGRYRSGHREMFPHTCRDGCHQGGARWQVLVRMQGCGVCALWVKRWPDVTPVECPQRTRDGGATWSRGSTSGCVSTGGGITVLKGCLHPHVHCGTVASAQDMKVAWVSVGRWMDGWVDGACVCVCVVCQTMLGHSEEESSAICDDINGPGRHYAR